MCCWVYKHFYYPHLNQQDDDTSVRAEEPLHGAQAECMLTAKQAVFAFTRISEAQKLWSAGISTVQTFGIPYFTFEEWYQMGLGSVQLSFPKRIWPGALNSGLKYPCNPVCDTSLHAPTGRRR